MGQFYLHSVRAAPQHQLRAKHSSCREPSAVFWNTPVGTAARASTTLIVLCESTATITRGRSAFIGVAMADRGNPGNGRFLSADAVSGRADAMRFGGVRPGAFGGARRVVIPARAVSPRWGPRQDGSGRSDHPAVVAVGAVEVVLWARHGAWVPLSEGVRRGTRRGRH